MDLFIVITLALLAVMGIIVGVSNDAVNFLNSAFGSKVAKKNVILTIAGVGVMVGVMTSSGMMDVARSGVFYPAMFSYHEVAAVIWSQARRIRAHTDTYSNQASRRCVLGYGTRRPQEREKVSSDFPSTNL